MLKTGSRTHPRIADELLFRLFVKSMPCAKRPPIPPRQLCGRARARNHAEKHFYIDAFRNKNDTRETLLRYTFQLHSVNVLICGNLCISGCPDPAVAFYGLARLAMIAARKESLETIRRVCSIPVATLRQFLLLLVS